MRMVAAGLVAIMAGLACAALAVGRETITGSHGLYLRLPWSKRWVLSVTVDCCWKAVGLSASVLLYKAMTGIHFRVLHVQVFYCIRKTETLGLF